MAAHENKMPRCYVTTLFFAIFLASCHGRLQNSPLTLEEQLEAAMKYQEKTFTRMENQLNNGLERNDMILVNVYKELDETKRHLEKLLEKMDMLSTKMESVEKELKTEMKDGLLKVVDRQGELVQQMKNLSENTQTQMLQMEDTLKQGLGEFVDISNNQSEAMADRVGDLCNINVTPVGCHQLLKEGVMLDGKYRLHLEKQNTSFWVYCDMIDDGGGWTVIMRRGDYGDKRTSFHRNWEEYRNGFGNLEQEFWLGNEKIHQLTSTGEFELRVTLTAFDGDVLRVKFDSFTIESEERNYRLAIKVVKVSGYGAYLLYHNGMPFSTWDRDNDKSTNINCASLFKSGWWFKDSYKVLLTGEVDTDNGIKWYPWKIFAPLKGAEMKIRPRDFR